MKEKYQQIINEVLEEIESALKEPKGIVSHQRRLAFAVSLGASTIIEAYLDKKEVFKGGGKIDHLWLKKKKENAKKLIANQIICPIENLMNLDKFLDIVHEIEMQRNKLAYGKDVPEEEIQKQIELFFKLKKEAEND